MRCKLTHISLKFLRIVCVVCANLQHGYLGPASDELCPAGLVSPSPIATDHWRPLPTYDKYKNRVSSVTATADQPVGPMSPEVTLRVCATFATERQLAIEYFNPGRDGFRGRQLVTF